MASVHTTRSYALSVRSKANEVGAWLVSLPTDATISLHVLKGDRPGESEVQTIVASWTEEI